MTNTTEQKLNILQTIRNSGKSSDEASPQEIATMFNTTITNRSEKPLSFSALQEWKRCPRNLFIKQCLGNRRIQETHHMKAGKVKHSEIELLINSWPNIEENCGDNILASYFSNEIKLAFEKVQPYMLWTKQAEMKFAIKGKDFVDFWDSSSDFRGVIDFVAFDKDKLVIADFKNGSLDHVHVDQLKWYAVAMLLKSDQLNRVVMKFISLRTGEQIKFTSNRTELMQFHDEMLASRQAYVNDETHEPRLNKFCASCSNKWTCNTFGAIINDEFSIANFENICQNS